MQLSQTHDLGDNTMAQAKTITTAEIERLLTHINTRKYAARNRSMMLLTHWALKFDTCSIIFHSLFSKKPVESTC